MNFTQVVKDSTFYLEAFITDSDGNGKAGLSVSFTIYKSSDDSTVSSGTMNDVGGGVYKTSVSFSVLDQYRVIYITPTGYENGIQTIVVINQPAEQETLENQTDILKRILGLSQENYRIFNPEFDKNSNLVGGLVRIYDNATDCEADTNPLAQYEMDAKYNLKNNKVSFYKMKRIA